MKARIGTVGLLLAALLAASVLLPPRGKAQEAPAGGSKRKVERNVTPVYPGLAREMHVMGRVKLETTIAADGHVLDTKVVGGSPLLVNAAIDAMKQWRFEPGPRNTTEEFVFDFDKPE
ncbi:MAG TPA: energy transducer TonB [Candidatus Acidoferrales bacterium]|jgi:protein TonB|nr:energy transducer TonB [Candidatus Acidoferrales bacterium]